MLNSWHYDCFVPKRTRRFQEFIESEIYLPGGPRKGLTYSFDFMPFDRAFFQILDSDQFKQIWITGPVQGGKSFKGMVAPILYHLFEVEEDVIFVAPDVVKAQELYIANVLPIIKSNPKLKRLLPVKGKGARGGIASSIQFKNGARIRFMGGTGNDAGKASFTARIIVMTEVGKFDGATSTSQDGNSVAQLVKRTNAFGDDARIYCECTQTTSDNIVNRKIAEEGTNSVCHFQCPHCKDFISFDRDHFVGWQDQDNVIDARDNSRYSCNKCGVIWSESDRQKALQKPIMVHGGQEIINGAVTGNHNKTNIFSFSWNAMSSSLLTMKNIGEEEYTAEKLDDADGWKDLFRFTWALPYDDEYTQSTEMNKNIILNKINKYNRGVIPEGSRCVVVGIDIGLYQCWWTAFSFKGLAEGYCIDYGCIEIHQEREPSMIATLNALRLFRDDYLSQGWVVNGEIKKPDMVFVDSGYKKDFVYEFTNESGARYYACKGFGSRKDQDSWRKPKPNKNIRIGNNWFQSRQPDGTILINIHADHWKTEVHNGFTDKITFPGSLSIYKEEKKHHGLYARHLCNEKFMQEWLPGKGNITFWKVLSRQNHYFDATVYARAAADMWGISMFRENESDNKTVKKVQPKKIEGKQWNQASKKKNWITR